MRLKNLKSSLSLLLNKKSPKVVYRVPLTFQRFEFVNSVDSDEAAHNEPFHLNIHYLPSSLRVLNMI